MKRSVSKLRRQIAAEAGRLLHDRVVADYRSARQKAVEKLALRARISAEDFPTDREIRRQIRAHSIRDREDHPQARSAVRLAAMRVMRSLDRFHPRMTHVLRGKDGGGDDFALSIISDEPQAVRRAMADRVGAHQVDSYDEADGRHTHWELPVEQVRFELKIVSRHEVERIGPRSDALSLAELEMLVAVDERELDLPAIQVEGTETDRFVLWAMLLARLEGVKQDPTEHPEGDALYHSLQAFELARERHGYDVELVTACLLHDVGKAVDPRDHVAAGLAVLAGSLTPREEFLIAHHMDAAAYQAGTLPQRLKRVLRNSEWFEDLMTLREIDNAARACGVEVCTIEEAIEFIASHEEEYE